MTYLGPPGFDGKYEGVTYAPAAGICTAAGSRAWDVSFGLPVTMPSGGLDLAAELKNAKKITVAIDAVAIDSIPTSAWEDAVNKMDHSSAAYTDLCDGKHYLLAAGAAIGGMTIDYHLDPSFSADLKANIKAGKDIQLGTKESPAFAHVGLDATGQVVTMKVASRAYVLGQLLRIAKLHCKMVSSTGGARRMEPDHPFYVPGWEPF